NLFVFRGFHAGTVRETIMIALLAGIFADRDLRVAADHDLLVFLILQQANVEETDLTIMRGNNLRTFHDAARRTTDVEGSEGQLRAGFADGLGGDDTDRFARTDHAAVREIQAVTFRTNTPRRFAGQDRADTNAINFRFLHLLRGIGNNQLARFDNN